MDKAPTFSYVFEDIVIVDRCLQFGWTSSPALWGVCAAAVEHAHNQTTFSSAEVTAEGKEATSHANIEPPRAADIPATLPPNCLFPPGQGGGYYDPLYVRTFVDDALFAELRGGRCLRASQSFASDSFRQFGSRSGGEPPLFARAKITSWDTRMEMLGWVIDTIAMTISVPQEKVAQLRVLLAQWLADRKVAPVKEVRSPLRKLLHLCEVSRPGKFFIQRILNRGRARWGIRCWEQTAAGTGSAEPWISR